MRQMTYDKFIALKRRQGLRRSYPSLGSRVSVLNLYSELVGRTTQELPVCSSCVLSYLYVEVMLSASYCT